MNKVFFLALLSIIFLISSVSADQVFTDDFTSYSNNYQVLDDFDQDNGWSACFNCSFSISNQLIAYNNSGHFIVNNTGQINRTLANVNLSRFQTVKIWVKVINNSDSDGYQLRFLDNNSVAVAWHINSNTNTLRRNILEINGSGFGDAPFSLGAGFNWQNITLMQIRENSLATFPGDILVDDIRLTNNLGDFGTNWTIPLEIDGRRGDVSIINESGINRPILITWNNASGKSQIAFLTFSQYNFTYYEARFTAKDYSNDTDNFHVLWTYNKMQYNGTHDLVNAYTSFTRNSVNDTIGQLRNSTTIKRRYLDGAIPGTPNETTIDDQNTSYYPTRNYTYRFINNNIKVYVDGNLVLNTWDNDTLRWLRNGTIAFRSPDNEIITSFYNFSLTNFTSINYYINESNKTSYIKNVSNDMIDSNSGIFLITNSATSKTIKSNLTLSVSTNVIVSTPSNCASVSKITYTPANGGTTTWRNSQAQAVCTNLTTVGQQLMIDPTVGASDNLLTFFTEYTCSLNESFIYQLVAVFMVLLVLGFVIFIFYQKGQIKEVNLKVIIIAFIAAAVGLVLIQSVTDSIAQFCS